MGRTELDPETLVDRMGWTSAKLLIGPPGTGAPPVEGLRSPEGLLYEVVMNAGKANKKEVERYMRTQTRAGYDVRLAWQEIEHKVAGSVTSLEGHEVVVERHEGLGIPKPWSGIAFVSDWQDYSCGGCPWQEQKVVEWTHQDLVTVERVTLYIRWRHADPWTGFIQRVDGEVDHCGFLYAPWSPNLLPEGPPEDPMDGGLFRFFRDTYREPGFLEADVDRVRPALFRKASEWLHLHGEDVAAWQRVTKTETSP